ncbi:MAG: YdcF family protein [Ruminococcaceae bacterium]|nr:YdcF family protein [Oscillospiraceae bacterium]
MKKAVISLICAILICGLLLSCMGCGGSDGLVTVDAPTDTNGVVSPDSGGNVVIPQPTEKDIISEMIHCYGRYQDQASPQVDAMLTELKSMDMDTGTRWQYIMDYWRYTTNQLTLNYDALPADVADGQSLCIVVLGFQLNADGTMQEELIGRLTTALHCAQTHPEAMILCTGGGTAYGHPEITEAGEMAKWLIENGVDEGRIIIENASRTTAENAMLSYGLLRTYCPQVNRLAIVTSDYHVAWGALLFQAQSILSAEDPSAPAVSVISNAAYDTGRGKAAAFGSQANGLLELLSHQ